MLNIPIRHRIQVLMKVSYLKKFVANLFTFLDSNCGFCFFWHQWVVMYNRRNSNLVYVYILTATFAKLPWVRCLDHGKDESFDIAFVGAPFVSRSSDKSSSNWILAGYRDLISTWRPFRPRRNSRRLSSVDPLWRLQCPHASKSLPIWTEDRRLRRYTRHPVRQ